jgi:hypothetical protein
MEKRKGRISNRPVTKNGLIRQAIGMIVVIVFVGFFMTYALDSIISIEDQLGLDASMFKLFEVLLLSLLITGFTAGLFQQILRYRKQQANPLLTAPPTPPAVAQDPIYKMAAEPVLQTSPVQQKVRFCPNCGNQLPTTKNFCPFCGTKLSTQASENGT